MMNAHYNKSEELSELLRTIDKNLESVYFNLVILMCNFIFRIIKLAFACFFKMLHY